MGTQASFLPVLCQRSKPPPGTLDAEFIAICEHTQERYLCKGQAKGSYLPAIEWICHSLALKCGLNVPPFAVVEMEYNPGTYYFGSQWLGGALDFVLGLPHVSNRQVFSQTLRFDYFAHNTDRHLNNYLYLTIAGDVVARPIDFGHSLHYNGFPSPPLPLPPTCNTMLAKPQWQAFHPYMASNTIQRLRNLPPRTMRDILRTMPGAWLPWGEKKQLLRWWYHASGMQQRCTAAQNCPT